MRMIRRAPLYVAAVVALAFVAVAVPGAQSAYATAPPTYSACPRTALGSGGPFSVLDMCVYNHNDTAVSSKSILKQFSTHSYTFQSGDYVQYDVHLVDCVSDSGGLDVIANGTAARSLSWSDQNSRSGADPDLTPSATGACTGYYHRKIAVPSAFYGYSSTSWLFVGMNSTPFLAYRAQYGNIEVTDNSNVVRTNGVIFNTWTMYDWNQQGDYSASSSSDVPGTAGNADASLNTVTTSGSNPQSPVVESTTYSTSDYVLAEYDVTASPYGADSTGASDASTAFQEALNDCYTSGGGVVWVPNGEYSITKPINIPPHCTLRGDWNSPTSCSTSCSAYGTTILATPSSGTANDPGLFRLWGGAGLNGLTIYYPDQTTALSTTTPTAYPYTIELLGATLGSDGLYGSTVENVTLINSYLGVSDGQHAVNEVHLVRNLYGTALNTALHFQNAADVSRTENVTFDSTYWAKASVLGPVPTQGTIATYTRGNATGLLFGGQEQEDFTNITLTDFQIGIDTEAGVRIDSAVNLFGLNISGGNVGFRINYLDSRWGINIAQSTIDANSGTNPVALETGTSNDMQGAFGPSVLIKDTTLGGGATTAIQAAGTDYVSCQGCTFDSWTGSYAVTATAGTVAVEGSTFTPTLTPSKKGVSLGSGVAAAVMIGDTYNASPSGSCSGYLYDTSTSGSVQCANAGFTFYPGVSTATTTNVPRPASSLLIKASDYGANGDGSTDNTSAIQQALNAASGTGGTVYVSPGLYWVSGDLSVPAGVELRGSDDVPHRGTENGPASGTILLATETGTTPFITLNGTGAGVRGISVDYPSQSTSTTLSLITAYPWTIRGNGPNVYVKDVSFVNAYQGVDFATNTTDGHVIDGITGLALKTGISVGNANHGWVENVHFSINGWSQAFGLPNVLDEQNAGTGATIWNVAFAYTMANGTYIHVGSGAADEHIADAFDYGGGNGIVVDGDSNVTMVNTGQDNTVNPLTFSTSGTVTLDNNLSCTCDNGGDVMQITAGSHVHVANFQNIEVSAGAAPIVINGGSDDVLAGGSLAYDPTSWTGGGGAFEGIFMKTTGTDLSASGSSTSANMWGNVTGGTPTFTYSSGAPTLTADNVQW